MLLLLIHRRRQVIIRERLKFPSGFSTAVLISVLHGEGPEGPQSSKPEELERAARGGFASLVPRAEEHSSPPLDNSSSREAEDGAHADLTNPPNGMSNMRLLVICFLVSGIFTILTYFFPIIRNIPIFGMIAADRWLWTLNPSLAYVGQGVIMGTETTLHMTLGAIMGWGLLSPLAKFKEWAPGPVDDWEHGSKGWIIWVSLAIMLVDAVVSLAYVGIRSIPRSKLLDFTFYLKSRIQNTAFLGRQMQGQSFNRYSLLQTEDDEDSPDSEFMAARAIRVPDSVYDDANGDAPDDAPLEQLVSGKLVSVGLMTSILLCIGTTYFVFGGLVPLFATIVAVLMALVLSIMGVRALGETDLNPVSGISKLAQLFFALIIPQSNKSSVLINLVAGAVVRTLPGKLRPHR